MPFFALFDRIVPAQNKYMATLFNANASRKVVVNRIHRLNWQGAAVVGVMLEQEIRFIDARTAGAGVPIVSEDSGMAALSSGITADTGSTGVTDSSLIRRIFASSEEAALAAATTNIPGQTAFVPDAQLVYWRPARSLGLVLRVNRGLTIKNLTNSIVGSVSYVVEFEDELA